MKKIINMLFLLFIFCSSSSSQNVNMPRIIPPSSQTSSFIRYGEIPVGHISGIPQIEVPIFTLQTGWIEIPISLSYHASGFRVRDIPSPVGLGWVLNAGGLISRSIELGPDFGRFTLDSITIKSKEYIESLKNGTIKYLNIDFSNPNNAESWEQFFFNYSWTDLPDTRSDRYSYNFLGKSGAARYDVNNKKIVPVPYDPLKIIRISENLYNIWDTEGIRYTFGYPDTTFVSGGVTPATSWYISKISSPITDDPIIFSYKRGPVYKDYGYSQTMRVINDVQFNGPTNNLSPSRPSIGCVNSVNSNIITNQSPLLEKITWRNVTILFDYILDRKDQRKERLNSIIVKEGENIIRQVFLENNEYFGDKTENYRLKLSGISISGSNINEKENYSFKYNEQTTLPSYYKYIYACQEDYWGYWNGGTSSMWFPSEIAKQLNIYKDKNLILGYTTDRSPKEYTTKACVLNEITYPTKGKTHFEYEINRTSNNHEVGGLRLKSRINYSLDGTISDIKEYEYQGQKTADFDFLSFMTPLKGKQQYTYNIGYTPGTSTLTYTGWLCMSSPTHSLTGWSSSPIFYSKVTEYNGSKSKNIGKTVYSYTYRFANSFGFCASIDGPDYNPLAFNLYSDCDNGFLKEYPSSVISFNSIGDTVKYIGYGYKMYAPADISTGVRVTRSCEYPQGIRPIIDSNGPEAFRVFLRDEVSAFNTYAFQDFLIKNIMIEIDYAANKPSISKILKYKYPEKEKEKPYIFKPNSISEINSNERVLERRFIYPFDYSEGDLDYQDLVNRNIISSPTEEIRYIEDKEIYRLKKIYYFNLWDRRSYLRKIAESFSGEKDLKDIESYQTFDRFENPVECTNKEGQKIFYIWNNEGKVIAEIKNVTAMQIIKALDGTKPEDLSSPLGDPDYKTLAGLRSSAELPNALITTYTYQPLVGMTSMTDPRGVTTTYEYDSFGRLKTAKDANGKVIQAHDYHYQNQ